MTTKVLLVDDDPNVLDGYQRHLRRYDLDIASNGPEALEVLAERGPFAVIVADMRMPGMSGLELLECCRSRWPHAIRIMLTGNSDQKTAADAVNQGQVFRFLAKPCPPEAMAEAIDAALHRFALESAERTLLERTLTGSLQVLTDLLSLLDPDSFHWAQVVRERARRIAVLMGYQDLWCVEAAALLAPIGRITLPPGLAARAERGQALNMQEQQLMDRVPETGAGLLSSIPRLEEVARIVKYQAKRFNGGGFPVDDLVGEAIPLGARILLVLHEFTRVERSRKDLRVAMEALKLHPSWYDPKVLVALESILMPPGQSGGPEVEAELLPTDLLDCGMLLLEDLKTSTGKVVVFGGTRLSAPHLLLIRDVRQLLGLEASVRIHKP